MKGLLRRPGILVIATVVLISLPTMLLIGGRSAGPRAAADPRGVALGSAARSDLVDWRHQHLVSTPAPAPAVPVAATGTATHTAAPAGPAPASPRPASGLPSFSHVFTIVMENEESTSILGNPAASYINGLASTYGLALNYYGVSHPSLPNYLALTAGSTFGIASDCTTCYVGATNIADQVEASGRSWKAYMEDMPSPCYQGAWSAAYAMKHDPFMYFNDIRTNAGRCAAHVVPLTQFWSDMASGRAPNYVFITPNMCNDMHDCAVATGDGWLRNVVPAITNSAAFRSGGVLFITWDEGLTGAGCCGDAFGGRVATLIISPMAIGGYRSGVAESHFSILRTIEDAWHLGHLGGAADPGTAVMREYFRS
ncbi:MAG TPA: alkaline phosphatase family protein [Candidatus Dormibacteraeota bacterium]